MTDERIARCNCGQLRVATSAAPARRSVCHCLECQRRTGSAFGLNATWPADQVRIAGDSRSWERHGEEGHWVRSHFCPVCGTTLFWEIERRPDMVSVAVGGFADPAFPEPTVSVYGERRHPWLRIATTEPVTEE